MKIERGIIKSRRAVIAFASPQNAERAIAGVPAVARAVREVAKAGIDECLITAGGNWQPSQRVASEIERLAHGVQVIVAAPDAAHLAVTIDGAVAIVGEQLSDAEFIRKAFSTGQAQQDRADFPMSVYAANGYGTGKDSLKLAERRVMLATAKPGDGLVARTINRPISRQISLVLPRIPWIRPIDATVLTAAVAIAMCVALFAGGSWGLIIGAFLFQAASILDGVDGEIARATFRNSSFGAAIDSLIDAATNVGFIGGIVSNLWARGEQPEAAFGAIGLGAMALGLLLIGLHTRRSTAPFTFDAIKTRMGNRPSRLRTWLTWLTMRDFYALAAFVFVVNGHAGAGLVAFATVALGWLAVVCVMLAGKSGSGSESRLTTTLAPEALSTPAPTFSPPLQLQERIVR